MTVMVAARIAISPTRAPATMGTGECIAELTVSGSVDDGVGVLRLEGRIAVEVM